VKAVDSSILVAAFATWHEKHKAARRALDDGTCLIEHCALECYSVLTRLPPPHRAPAELVGEFLRSEFPGPYLRIGARTYRRFLLALAGQGIVGGAVYDALVAATAAEHEVVLLSCDRRAATTYERSGVRFELV
jgi:predicted nucleic acid-binding protein